MRKRFLLVFLVASLGILFLLGFLVNRTLFYLALILGMIFMHLFGHGHGHQHETASEA